MKVQIDVDMGAVMDRVGKMRKAAVAAASEQALSDSNIFVPFHEGYLMESSQTHSDIENGHLEWATPYARYLFYGKVYGPNYPIFDGGNMPSGYYSPPVKHPTGRKIKYKRGKHPNASARWTLKAKAEYADDWRLAAEKAIKKVK